MSVYQNVFVEAIKLFGWKKVLAELLNTAKIIDKDTVGQFVANLNSGGITDAFINKKITG